MRLALVTGGGRRIGAAIARRLAADGWSLALTGRGEGPEEGLADDLRQAGAAWRWFAADLGDADRLAALPPTVEAACGGVPTLLVNNAARFDADTPETLSAACLAAQGAVNVAAPVALGRWVAGAASADRPAAVVNILDQRISQPHADQLSYTLSKLALAELTAILARHWAPHVRVAGVAPGLTLPTGEYTPAQMARAAAAMPLARLPRPEEVADAVAWLAAAGAVTGQVLFVDGGAHLCRFERDFLYL